MAGAWLAYSNFVEDELDKLSDETLLEFEAKLKTDYQTQHRDFLLLMVPATIGKRYGFRRAGEIFAAGGTHYCLAHDKDGRECANLHDWDGED